MKESRTKMIRLKDQRKFTFTDLAHKVPRTINSISQTVYLVIDRVLAAHTCSRKSWWRTGRVVFEVQKSHLFSGGKAARLILVPAAIVNIRQSTVARGFCAVHVENPGGKVAAKFWANLCIASAGFTEHHLPRF
jgi:hypothetical protein